MSLYMTVHICEFVWVSASEPKPFMRFIQSELFLRINGENVFSDSGFNWFGGLPFTLFSCSQQDTANVKCVSPFPLTYDPVSVPGSPAPLPLSDIECIKCPTFKSWYVVDVVCCSAQSISGQNLLLLIESFVSTLFVSITISFICVYVSQQNLILIENITYSGIRTGTHWYIFNEISLL